MRRRRTLIVVALVGLSACGSGAEPDAQGAPATAEQPTGTAATAADEATDAPDTSDAIANEATTDANEATAETTTPAPAATEDDSTLTTEPTSTDAPAEPPAPTATDAPVATGDGWPDDGCSADNTPTGTDVAEGPIPSLDIRAASADSVLPDLAVRRVNCNGGWVNLKNELPSERPLLVWFWAPH